MSLISQETQLNSKEKEKLSSLQLRIDEVYSSHQVFSLSLETLELTRRFIKLYEQLESAATPLSRAEICNLISISKHLERNLEQELIL